MHPAENEVKPLSYSISDACKAIGVGRTTIYTHITNGRLKVFKMGGRTLIDADDLKSWLSSFQKAA